MLNPYTLTLFVHISAAFIWLGGGLVMEAISLRLGPSPSNAALKEFFALGSWLSPRLFAPAAILTLLSGIGVVSLSTKTHFHDFSVVYAIAAVIIAMLFGMLGIGPTIEKLSKAIDDPSVSVHAIDELKKRLRLVSHIDLAILITVLFDVTTEPKWDSYPFMLLVALFLIGVVLYNALYTPHQQAVVH